MKRYPANQWTGPGPLEGRLMRRVVKQANNCWVWQGALKSNGYGNMGVTIARGEHVVVPVHRVAYELFIGPIPEGCEIDHLCNNKPCVNPDHLEAVPHRVNARRREARRKA